MQLTGCGEAIPRVPSGERNVHGAVVPVMSACAPGVAPNSQDLIDGPQLRENKMGRAGVEPATR